MGLLRHQSFGMERFLGDAEERRWRLGRSYAQRQIPTQPDPASPQVVEDEDPVRIFGARALRNKGYKVLEAKSGEGALEIIRDGEKIDLLITDVVMPRMDGPALIREVRETHPDMKVIFISGYTEDSFRKRLDTEAEIHFLPKPFTLKQLAGKVKEVMIAGTE